MGKPASYIWFGIILFMSDLATLERSGDPELAGKTICSAASAYSALTILNDGTIGIYYEAGEYETYQMYFARFSLDWLSDGKDTWIGKSGLPVNGKPGR